MLCDICAIRATALAVRQTSSADSGGEELGPGAGCNLRPPAVEPAPDDDTFVSNTLATNAGNPIPFGGLELFAADFTYLAIPPSQGNCFAKNTYTTFKGIQPFPLAKTCN